MLLTDRQRKFVDAYALSANAADAARKAGYSEHTARQQGARLLSNANVISALQEQKNRYACELGVSKGQVIGQIVEAIQMGRAQERPEVLIQGAVALAKLCGFFEPLRVAADAPEGLAAEVLSRRFAAMSDAELYALASEGSR